MLYSGIGWTAAGYEVAVVDEGGGLISAPVTFGPGQVGAMTAYLTGLTRSPDAPLVTVVDSTNGMLDGGMMVAGLDMYRADPWVLPPPPGFGSVPAVELAHSARRDTARLARLEVRTGTLTGRLEELDAGIRSSERAVQELSRAGRCIGRVDTAERVIALTFDDGPNPPYTGQVLDTLDRYGIPATFFCVGLHVGAHREDLARMAEAGHQLGNHTWSHAYLPDLSRGRLEEQLERTDEIIAATTGLPAPGLFRPPYGSRTPEVMDWLSRRQSTVVLWDVEPFDWALPGADTIARITLEQARPGSVILLHDGGGDRSQTVAALPAIIEGLLEREFRFVRIDALTAARHRLPHSA
ncbi:polysaccharide deacetylase family protein [Streptomyces sp. MST-110588]|uniref:polysaccharide deacetylase family protein n=1 Tax=Streptomyces sp. MST-110588 TaxID=2833628 RepID=UPI001F5CD538|nr:polysaccharide deacetylase family protein [Streptomyces sp. MST-110588]UNO39183.1 polysaccharide deacetylase family protein [Streptomyces sp. MST-110588]